MTPDEQEALSRKYSESSLRILALSSGKFALFLPFSNDGGMPLAEINTWAELEAVVRAHENYKEPERVTEQRKQDQINLEELFGASGEG